MKKLEFDLQAHACNDFLLNTGHLILIDIAPNAATSIFKRLAKGINNLDPNSNDELDQTAYMDGGGYKDTTVIGGQFIIPLTGHRAYTDDAQNFIFDLQLEIGCNRETEAQFIKPDGSKVAGDITIANITGGSGAAAAKGDIGFELHFNGKPTYTAVAAAADLGAVFAAGAVSGTTKFTATPAGTNALEYTNYGVAEPVLPNLNTEFIGTAYTSGDDITGVTAGDWFLAVEVDEWNRVVEVTKYELQSGDIAV